MNTVSKDQIHRDKAEDELNAASSKVSELCRFFGLGFIALSYSILVSDAASARVFLVEYNWLILLLSVSGATTLALDFSQYYASYLQARYAFANKEQSYLPGQKWVTTRLRHFCYHAKQIVCLLGVAVMLVASISFFYISLDSISEGKNVANGVTQEALRTCAGDSQIGIQNEQP